MKYFGIVASQADFYPNYFIHCVNNFVPHFQILKDDHMSNLHLKKTRNLKLSDKYGEVKCFAFAMQWSMIYKMA